MPRKFLLCNFLMFTFKECFKVSVFLLLLREENLKRQRRGLSKIDCSITTNIHLRFKLNIPCTVKLTSPGTLSIISRLVFQEVGFRHDTIWKR